MKTLKNFLVLGLVFSLSVTSCKKDDELVTERLTSEDVQNESRLDRLTDDVNAVVDDQYTIQAGRMAVPPVSSLPACATVTVTTNQAAGTWTRTVDFGTGGTCTFNGAVLRGKIIVSGSLNFSQTNYVLTFTFDEFYHNNWKVNGVRQVTRTIDAQTQHPKSTIDVNFTVTSPNGNQFTRVGQRVREFVSGYDTVALNDNVFSITGSWTTTGPNGVRTATITSPIKWDASCQYRVTQGVITLTRNNNTATIDYGNGSCDNTATIVVNGGNPVTFAF